jgi:hypothetical protein
MKKTLTLVAFLVAVAALRADIIPTFTGAAASGNNTVWSYKIDITVNADVTTGDFFTIYDFGPFVAGTAVAPAGWTFSFSNLGPTPSGVLPPDDPSIVNITWTYTGPTLHESSNIGPFSIATAGVQTEPSLRTGYFAAQATSGPNPTTKLNNVGRITVPTLVPVPEPTTLSLLALGAIGAAFRTVRRRK